MWPTSYCRTSPAQQRPLSVLDSSGCRASSPFFPCPFRSCRGRQRRVSKRGVEKGGTFGALKKPPSWAPRAPLWGPNRAPSRAPLSAVLDHPAFIDPTLATARSAPGRAARPRAGGARALLPAHGQLRPRRAQQIPQILASRFSDEVEVFGRLSGFFGLQGPPRGRGWIRLEILVRTRPGIVPGVDG